MFVKGGSTQFTKLYTLLCDTCNKHTTIYISAERYNQYYPSDLGGAKMAKIKTRWRVTLLCLTGKELQMNNMLQSLLPGVWHVVMYITYL